MASPVSDRRWKHAALVRHGPLEAFSAPSGTDLWGASDWHRPVLRATGRVAFDFKPLNSGIQFTFDVPHVQGIGSNSDMLRKKAKYAKIAICLILGFLLFTTTYLSLWGRLFPFSPVIVGFSKQEGDRAIIYAEVDVHFENLALIDQCIVSVEQAHGLAFKQKPEIFLLKTPAKFQRLTGSTVRFKTFPVYGRVLVSPHALEEADKGLISLPIYLKHELSHSLLFQHMTLYRFFKYPIWLLEGIATQSSGMMGHAWYPDKKATHDLIREGNFLPPRDFGTKNEDATLLKVPNKAAFVYSEFACIVDDLMDNYGREKVLAYIKALFNGSDDLELFRATFRRTFGDYLSDFQRRINQGAQRGRTSAASGDTKK